MTQPDGGSTGDPGLEWIEVTPQARLQQHWGLLLTYGAVTFLLGVALAVWPDETVKVVAWLLAFQLVVMGCMRVFIALADSTAHGGARLLSGFAGAVAIVIGVMFAFEPLQTIGLLVVLAGSLLVLMGFVDLAELLVSTGSERRLWDVVGGALSVFAGGFLIVSPERSLELLRLGDLRVAARLRLRDRRVRPLPALAEEGVGPLGAVGPTVSAPTGPR